MGLRFFFCNDGLDKKDKRDEQAEKVLAKENVLIIKSINAVGKLTEATAIALVDGKLNGEIHSALKEYSTVDKEMYNYLLERNAHK
ncbi:MAG: hypothetical protein ACOX2Y_02935 [Christensenellales bacterium]